MYDYVQQQLELRRKEKKFVDISSPNIQNEHYETDEVKTPVDMKQDEGKLKEGSFNA
jgi:hypothetical protein